MRGDIFQLQNLITSFMSNIPDTTNNYICPASLNPGDCIGIISPSGVVDCERLQPGIDYLKKVGFKVMSGEHIYKKNRYLAGSDQERLSDLHDMFSNPEISAIFVARGGYGSARLLDNVDYSLIRNNPKNLSGFSDTTALQLAIFSKTRLVTYSGITLCTDCNRDGLSRLTNDYFWNLCRNGEFNHIQNLNIIKPGNATGTLIAGCLSIITSLTGTEYIPPLDHSILVIEDVNEEPYKIDRMLTQLRLNGVFEKINGLVFGHFKNCTPENKNHGDVEAIFKEVAEYVEGPVFSNLDYGHDINRIILPVGADIQLSTDSEHGVMRIDKLVDS